MRRELWALGAFYFFIFGALGTVLPFLPLALEARGLSATAIGRIVLWVPAATLWAPPIWGVLADWLRARRRMMQVGTVGAGLGLWAVASGRTELGIWLAVVAFGFFRSPLSSMADAATHAALADRGHRFARVRLWGSLGFLCFAGLVSRFGSPQSALWVGAATYGAAGVATLWLRPGVPALSRPTAAWARDLWAGGRPLALLWVGTVLYAAGTGVYDGYVGLHLSALGMDAAFVGWVWVVAVGAEVILMALAPAWLPRLDLRKLLPVLAGVAALRWLLLSVLTDPGLILASQTLHAFTFGLWYLTLSRRVQSQAREDQRTSLQAFSAAAMGSGLMLGVGLGGPIFDAWGSGAAFRCGALAALLGGCVYAAEGWTPKRFRVERTGQAQRTMETSGA